MSEHAPAPGRANKISTMHVHAAGVVGVLCLAAVGYAFGYLPSAKAQAGAHARREAVISAMQEASGLKEQLGAARAELEAIRATQVVAPVFGADLIGRITESMADESLLVQNIAQGEPTTVGPLLRSPVEIQGTGSFSDIVGWLRGMPESLPGVAVDSLSIMPEPMDESTLVIQASLSAYAPQASQTHATKEPSQEEPHGRGAPAR